MLRIVDIVDISTLHSLSLYRRYGVDILFARIICVKHSKIVSTLTHILASFRLVKKNDKHTLFILFLYTPMTAQGFHINFPSSIKYNTSE